MATETKHFYWLDWLRFAAALMVVLSHARVHNWVEWNMLPPDDRNPFMAMFLAGIRLGPQAVVLFFVLSGFLVGGRLFVRLINREYSLSDYALDRFARIALPLVPAVILTIAVNYFVVGEPPRETLI